MKFSTIVTANDPQEAADVVMRQIPAWLEIKEISVSMPRDCDPVIHDRWIVDAYFSEPMQGDE